MAGFPKYAQGRQELTYKFDINSTSAGVATAFGSETYVVRLTANTPSHYRIYDAAVSSTATSADPFLPLGVVEIVGVTPGQKISAIMASALNGASTALTSVAGSFWITEIS